MAHKQKGSAIGVSLLLVVFILLCFITFGTLSYLQAKRDNDLSVSAAQNVTEYYLADADAHATLQNIDQTLKLLYTQAGDQAAYYTAIADYCAHQENCTIAQEEEGLLLSVQTTVSEKETLVSTLQIEYPVSETYYRITAWKLRANAA